MRDLIQLWVPTRVMVLATSSNALSIQVPSRLDHHEMTYKMTHLCKADILSASTSCSLCFNSCCTRPTTILHRSKSPRQRALLLLTRTIALKINCRDATAAFSSQDAGIASICDRAEEHAIGESEVRGGDKPPQPRSTEPQSVDIALLQVWQEINIFHDP
jgi:hypothetical protein